MALRFAKPLSRRQRTFVRRSEAGKALVFIQSLLQRGAAVEEGRKYVLRSNVM